MEEDELELGNELLYNADVPILTFAPSPPTALMISNIDNDGGNNIVFTISTTEWQGFELMHINKEMLKINKDGFFVEEKKVEDINNVYDQFSGWMNHVAPKD